MDKIHIEGIKIYAYHGCFEEEAKVGTNFNIDVLIEADLNKVKLTDNINDTINYQTIFEIIKKEMKIPSKTLEHISNRCINKILYNFNTIKHITLKISKLNPPLGGKIDKVSLIISNNINL